MQRAGLTPPGGVRPDDVVAVYERTGPFATVWCSRSGEEGFRGGANAFRADDAVRALAEGGCSEAVQQAIADELDRLAPGIEGAVVVADEGGIVLLEALSEPPRHDLTRCGPLPSLSAVLEHRQAQIPWIAVLADRTGADIVATTAFEKVVGDDYPLRKTGQGGWSQPRYQQRAENTWDRNAGIVAERVTELVTRSRPAVIVLGGDERAVQLITDHLPDETKALVRTITPGRAADGSEARRDHEIERMVRTAIAEETVELLRCFEDQLGQGERAVNGVSATVRALQRAQVNVLLVHDVPADDRQAWFGEAGEAIALRRSDLDAMGEGHRQSDRLADVAIRAALLTGATVRVVPNAAALDGGIGAILRWSD